MTCVDARRRISPYLDSELDPTTTFEISEHLRLCEACRDRFEAERLVDQELARRWFTGRLPDETWRAIQRQTLKSAVVRVRWAPLLLAAAALVIVVVSWQWQSLRSKPFPGGERLLASFMEMTSGGKAFPSDAPPARPGRMAAPGFPEVAIMLAAEVTRAHRVQIVSLAPRVEPDGATVLEMRLNCCGEPVLVELARTDAPGHLADSARGLAGGTRFARKSGLNLAGKRLGDFVVVAVSHHPVEEILDAFVVQ